MQINASALAVMLDSPNVQTKLAEALLTAGIKRRKLLATKVDDLLR